MKKFILPLILLFAACGTEAEVEPDAIEYPLQIGTWEVTSATRADWQGDAYMVNNAVAKANSDTVWVTEPEGQGLTLWVEYEKSEYFVQDVIFTYEGDAGSLSDGTIHALNIAFSDSSSLGRGNWWATQEDFDISDGQLSMTLRFGYDCSRKPVKSSEVGVTLIQRNGDETDEITYIFNTHGMTEVIEHLYCWYPHDDPFWD